MKYLALLFMAITLITYAEVPKVLYVTHEPGKYHAYTPQKEIFKKLAKEQGWDATISTGKYKDQEKALAKKDFAAGHDVIVYNFCLAHNKELDTVANIIAQTQEKGTPAIFIHCSMHSFWSTYKKGEAALSQQKGSKAKLDQKTIDAWKTKHGDKPFPVWGDFTGIASTGHGPRLPIQISKLTDHPAVKSLGKDGYTTAIGELYNNAYIIDGVTPLLEGVQTRVNKKNGKTSTSKAIVMWQCPQGKSEVIGLSLGHGTDEWNQKEFQQLIIDSVQYLSNVALQLE